MLRRLFLLRRQQRCQANVGKARCMKGCLMTLGPQHLEFRPGTHCQAFKVAELRRITSNAEIPCSCNIGKDISQQAIAA